MKKELKFFLLGMGSVIAVIVLGIGGLFLFYQFQNNNNSSDSGSSNKLSKESFVKCDVLDNVKMSSKNNGSFIITNNNDLYVIDYNKKFSDNDSNCKKINSTNIAKLLDDGYVMDDSNNKYSIRDNTLELTSNYDKYLENEDFLVYLRKSYNGIKSEYDYVLKKDGKIYKVIFKGEDYKEELYKSFDNETIVDFGTTFSGTISYVKTNNAYYTSLATNKKECEEYADVKCNYELQKDEFLTSKYDEISYIDIENDYIIMKDGNRYRRC